MVLFRYLGFADDRVRGAAETPSSWNGGPVPYLAAWAEQRAVHSRVAAGLQDPTVLLLEHEAVYTAGKRTLPEERPLDGTPVVDVDRGGKITWHGPGQLVGYPIVPLHTPIDVVAYVRRLERALMNVCAEFGVETICVEGRSGVWLPADGLRPERKVAAIGIRVSKTTTMHGFALNCENDLGWGRTIIPCGIADAGITSLTVEAKRRIGVADVMPAVERELRRLVGEVARCVEPATFENP